MSKQLKIGRNESNDIVLSHPYLSESHAILSLVNPSKRIFHIVDLDTTNGTYKNGERITEADFTEKDTISLAGMTLEVKDYVSLFVEDQKSSITSKAKTSKNKSASKTSSIKVPTSGGLFAANSSLIVVAIVSLASLIIVSGIGFTMSEQMNADVLLQIMSMWLLIMLGINLSQSVIRMRRQQTAEDEYRDIMFREWKGRNDQALKRLESKLATEQDSWQGFRKFNIVKRVDECEGITSFYLSPHDKKRLPKFNPGQYLTFRLDIPGQDKPVIRCYSLSDAYHETYYRVSIKKAPPPPKAPDAPWGLSSSFFHDQLEVDSILDIKAPSGKFYLNEDSEKGVVLIAGGVGITPMISMLNSLIAANSKREIWFFYGVRYGAEVAMHQHLKTISEQHDNVHLNLCFSDPKEGEVEGVDYQFNERVSADLFKRLLPSNNYEYYLCGPPPMMTSITDGLVEWGVPENDVYFEAFGPASVKKKKSTSSEAPATATAFEVEFSKSGKKLNWDGSSDSLLEFAETNGVELPSGCRAGNCGTCQVAIRKGDIQYTSEHDVDVESGSCLTCISVPKEDIVLDA